MRTLLVLLALLPAVTRAGVLDSDFRAELTQRALAGFWGKARDSAGKPILPESAQDRATVPVAPSVVEAAINAGEISGLAEWCGLAWKPRYYALTRSARNEQMTDKQVAFISVLHGATQQTMVSTMGGKHCGDQERSKVLEALAQPVVLRR
ncbi:MAG: hypothetical protein ACT6S0_20310 [Roseateles sp.]|uniref:hypothetical protein n=1 Tax=Roseateles sp. TaxID=1971397 RepID=UPI004035201D